MNNDLLRTMIFSMNEDDCSISYDVISEALHTLDNAGENDLEEFKRNFIRNKLTKKEQGFMEWHLRRCKPCLDDVLFIAKLYKTFAFADNLSNSLNRKAQSHIEAGNITEAIKCYEEALELKPGDEKIKNLILETKKSVFEVIVGGEKQTPEWEGNQAYIPISKPSKVKFIRDNKILSEKIYKIENFRGSRLAAKSHGETTPSKKQLEVIYSDKDITIQLEKGSTEGKFIITLSINE